MKQKILFHSVLTMLLVLMQFSFVFADNISTSKSVGTPKGVLEVSATGAATYTIPISCPKGYGNMTPNLSLVYNSQSGYGYVGYGCNVSGLSVITRGCKDIYHDGTASGVKYANDDAYFLDGKRLIYQSVEQGEAVYVPEGEPFSKVIFHVNEGWLELKTNDGLDYCYGKWSDSRQTIDNLSDNPVNAWYLTYVSDTQHRFMRIYYSKRSLSIYPSSVSYGMEGGVTSTIRFTYENIKNKNTAKFNMGGTEDAILVRLKNITTETNNQVFRKYECVYDSTLDASGVKYSRLTQVIEKNGKGEALNPIQITWKGLPNVSYKMNLPEIQFLRTRNINSRIFYSGDVNGDGLCDVIEFTDVTDEGNRSVYATYYLANPNKDGTLRFGLSKSYNLGPNFSTKWIGSNSSSLLMDIDGDGINEMASPSINSAKGVPATVFARYYKYGKTDPIGHAFNLKVSEGMPLFVSFDADKDGKDEFIGLEVDGKNGKYAGFFDKLASGTNFETTDFTLSLPQQPKRLFVGDYNNDGLADLLVLYQDGYTVFYNQGGRNLRTLFDDNHKYSSNTISEKWRIEQGDFDGDGLVDFIYAEKSGDTYFALNKGNGTFETKYAIKLDMVDKKTGQDDERFSFLTFDMDGDGKMDLLAAKTDYGYHGGIFHTKHYTYRETRMEWLRSNGNNLVLDKTVLTNNEDDARNGYVIAGDFTGNGHTQVLNYGKNIYDANPSDVVKLRMYCNTNLNVASGKVCKIVDGLGNESTLNYASLLDRSVNLATLNNYGLSTSNSSSYPVLHVSVPLSVVRSMQSNGNVINYQYGNLKVHVLGKGMLGFDKLIAKNETTGETVENIVEKWDSTYWTPTKTRVRTLVGEDCAYTNSTNTVVPLNHTYFSYMSRQDNTDLDDDYTCSEYVYNTQYGYLMSQKTNYRNDSMYKLTRYDSYVKIGRVYLPTEMIESKMHADSNEETFIRTFWGYDDYGQIVLKERHGQSILTTHYERDKFGNIVSMRQVGHKVSSVQKKYEYDSTGRFLVKEYSVPSFTTICYSVDNWGNITSRTDLTNENHPLVTTYTLDNWGNVIRTEAPTGVIKTVTKKWGNSKERRYAVVEEETDMPAVTTWYDSLGRTVESSYYGLLGTPFKKAYSYDKKGLLIEETQQKGENCIKDTKNYDARGRVVSEINNSKSISYSYCPKTVTTRIAEKTYTKSWDAWGNLHYIEDPLNTVFFTYSSVGKPENVSIGKVSIKMGYDDVGNRLRLDDPNAGTILSEYTADDKVLSTTDARGVVTNYAYDEFGRLSSINVGGIVTTYQYGGSSDRMQLKSITQGDKKESYEYDEYGRMITKRRTIGNKGSYEYNYSYDSSNRLLTKTYPGGLVVYYDYEAGLLRRIMTNSNIVYFLAKDDGYVQKVSVNDGKMQYDSTLDERGKLSNINVKNPLTGKELFDMNLSYDANTDNLMSRTGMRPEKETFAYDKLDRLVSVSQGDSTTMNVKYSADGNILYKTNVGNYEYGLKPHAVMNVENPIGLIPHASLTTQFNELGKVERIEDGNTLQSLEVEYGPDQERWISTLSRNNQMESTRIYFDDYEKTTDSAGTHEIYYLGDRSIYIRDNGGDFKCYFLVKDNLGSIVKAYDTDENLVYEASYDAWGKQTVTKDSIGLYRGYCGHEMLNDFDIINMNGRLYDPVLGRFLSPDNYVQMPDNSQNFNRYSYCLNNPLKYIDPSGNLFGIDDAIWAFAFFCATSNAILANKSGKSPWSGALVGGLSSLASYGVGSLFGHSMGTFGHELLRAGAHGLTSGTLNWINGDNFFTGAASGTAASLMGSGAQSLRFGAEGVLAAASIGGGIGSLATGGNFMDGFGIGFNIGSLNHNGKAGKIITIERKLPPVVCVADNLSYRKTFGYWLLGVGSGASSGPYRMWNPDAISMSVGGTVQIGSFHLGGDVGLMMGPGKLYPYINYDKGVDITSWGFNISSSLNVNMYVNKGDMPLSLSALEGQGYNAGVNLGVGSLDYGVGVDWLGLPTSAQYESYGIGIGPGVGVHGNFSTTQYLVHY